MEMANFVFVSEIPLFENNTYYVKYVIWQSSLSIQTILKTLHLLQTLNSKLKNIHRNHSTSLGISNSIMVIFRQVITEMFGDSLKLMVL